MSQLSEIRPALNMTHATEQECREHVATKFWARWAARNSCDCSIQRREYYNLPAQGRRPEAIGSEPETESQWFWELHIMADPSAPCPSRDAATNAMLRMHLDAGITLDEAIDAAIRDTEEMAAIRESKNQQRLARLAANLADLPSILPGQIMMGTLMVDDLYERGGRARELAEDCRHGLISSDDLRSAIVAARQT